MAVAYLLLFFMCHRFYLGRPITGALQWVLSLASISVVVFGFTDYAEYVDQAASIAVTVWCLYDATVLPRWVRAYEDR